MRIVGIAFVSLCMLGEIGCRRPVVPGSADIPAYSETLTRQFRDLSPRWSHDGKHIAFLRETADHRHQLFLADAQLKSVKSLLPPEAVSPDRDLGSSLDRLNSPQGLAFTAQDNAIAFPRADWVMGGSGERIPGQCIWLYERSKGQTKPLAVHPPRYRGRMLYYHFPQWSPDGKYLSFVGEGLYGERSVFLRLLNRKNPLDYTSLPDQNFASDWAIWEPKRSALTWAQSVRRAPSVPFTQTLRRAFPGAPPQPDSGEFWRKAPDPQLLSSGTRPFVSHLAWSPDGSHLAFAFTNKPTGKSNFEIWVMRHDGKEARRLLNSPTESNFAPVWIGNSRVGGVSRDSKKANYVVLSWNLEGKDQRVHGEIETADCDWSPDRKHIVYATKSPSTIQTTLRILSLKNL